MNLSFSLLMNLRNLYFVKVEVDLKVSTAVSIRDLFNINFGGYDGDDHPSTFVSEN